MCNEPLISILVPVYNYVDYVKKCIESICAQTYKNLQIIVIDDGSTDGSSQIIDELAEKDERIVVRHKKNGGIGSAYTMAFSIMSGDYIAFVDSDDYLEKNAYREVMDVALSTKADIVAYGASYYDLNGKKITDTFSKAEIIVGRDNIMNDYINKDRMPLFSRKICKMSLFDGMKVPSHSIGIDEAMSIQVYNKAEKLVKIEGCYYNVLGCDEKDSVGNRAIHGKYISEQIDLHNFIIDYLKEANSEYLCDYLVFYLRFLRGRSFIFDDSSDGLAMVEDEYKRIWLELNGKKYTQTMSFKLRASLALYNASPRLYRMIYKTVYKKV